MKHLKTILAVWGGISGLLTIGAVTYFVFYFTVGNTNRYDMANKNDVRFVLNWCELGDKRIESVVHSYESARSLTGDHLDAYAIKISDVNIDELEKPNQDYIKWTRGDNVNGVLKQAVGLASSFIQAEKFPWFPDKELLFSEKIYINSWSILLHGERVSAAKLIFVNSSENMIYYASVKT